LAELVIDASKLPASALVDSSIIIAALGEKSRPTDDPASKPFFEAMLRARRRILIAAPSVAEVLRGPSSPIPRVRGIVIVPFDQPTAEILSKEFPIDVIKYPLYEPRSRRSVRRDASSRSWTFDQREAVCSGGGSGVGTVMSPTSISSSRSEMRARVARQYLGASSR